MYRSCIIALVAGASLLTCKNLSAQESQVVWTDVSISASGRIREVIIDNTAHQSLRNIILREYKSWQVEPAMKDDETVKSTSGMMVFFEMVEDPELGFHIDVTEYRLAARRVHVVAAEYPDDALEKGLEGEVELSFEVNIRGNPKKVRVVRSDPPGVFDKAAVRALKQWKFDARTKGDKPTRSNETETLYFTLQYD